MPVTTRMATMPNVVIVDHDDVHRCIYCAAALRRQRSITEQMCCCCRRHDGEDVCALCTHILHDEDGAGGLCRGCREVAA